MKLPELKKHFQKRYVIRIVAGVLTVALVTGGAVYAGRSSRADAGTVGTQEDAGTVGIQEDAGVGASADDGGLKLSDMIVIGETEVGKEETVYLISDARGNVRQTIVTEHLYNRDGAAVIVDKSNLTDIENVKGRETFEKNGDSLTWQADGSDIYYRGNSDAKAPVSQKVTYYLDGAEISPEELAGKSGKVRIRFDYTNNSSYVAAVNGKDIEVKVPFAAVTGMMLDDGFSNIEVTNGRLKNSGDSNIVIGYALPGLKESLDVGSSDFMEDIDIPEYFEVTADVEGFSLDMAMTVVLNAAELSDIRAIDTTDMDDTINELSDASGQLEDGSKELSDGLDTVKGSMEDFVKGMGSLSDGLKDYTDGADRLDDGVRLVQNGVNQLDASKNALSDGIGKLKKGAGSAKKGADQLVSGYKGDGTDENPGLVKGAKSLADGAKSLAGGIDQLAAGMEDDKETGKAGLVSGTKALSEGAAQLAVGAEKLDEGVDSVAQTLGSMPEQMRAAVQATLDEKINSTAKDLFVAMGLTDGNGVTTENLDAVTAAVAGAEEKMIDAMISSKLPSGVTLEVYAQAYPQEYAAARQQAEASYNALLAGLYQAQGAMTVVSQTGASLASQASDIKALTDGSEALKNGLATLKTGVTELYGGVGKLNAGVKELDSGADALSSGASTIYSGVKQLYSGTKQLDKGLGDLNGGLAALNEQAPKLVKGIGALKDGTDELADGSHTLVSNNKDLLRGMKELLDGTGKLDDGVDKLADGGRELADGMAEFNEKAIDKMVNSYNGDIKELTDRIQAVLDAGNDYQIFTDVTDDAAGSVKFIYKLDAV